MKKDNTNLKAEWIGQRFQEFHFGHLMWNKITAIVTMTTLIVTISILLIICISYNIYIIVISISYNIYNTLLLLLSIIYNVVYICYLIYIPQPYRYKHIVFIYATT